MALELTCQPSSHVDQCLVRCLGLSFPEVHKSVDLVPLSVVTQLFLDRHLVKRKYAIPGHGIHLVDLDVKQAHDIGTYSRSGGNNVVKMHICSSANGTDVTSHAEGGIKYNAKVANTR